MCYGQINFCKWKQEYERFSLFSFHQYCFKASVEFALTPPFHRVDLHKGCRRATCNQKPIKLDYFRWLFVHVVESLWKRRVSEEEKKHLSKWVSGLWKRSNCVWTAIKPLKMECQCLLPCLRFIALSPWWGLWSQSLYLCHLCLQ